MTNQEYIQSIVDAMAKSGIIANDTEISGTQIAEIIENVKTLDLTTSGDATANDIREGKKAWVGEKEIAGNLPTQIGLTVSTTTHRVITAKRGIYDEDKLYAISLYTPSSTIIPTTYTQTLYTQNRYVTSNILIKGSQNLTPDNIKKGVDIFGVIGTLNAGGLDYNLSIDISTAISEIVVIVYMQNNEYKIKIATGNETNITCSMAMPIALTKGLNRLIAEDLIDCTVYYANDLYSSYPVILPSSNGANLMISPAT